MIDSPLRSRRNRPGLARHEIRHGRHVLNITRLDVQRRDEQSIAPQNPAGYIQYPSLRNREVTTQVQASRHHVKLATSPRSVASDCYFFSGCEQEGSSALSPHRRPRKHPRQRPRKQINVGSSYRSSRGNVGKIAHASKTTTSGARQIYTILLGCGQGN